MGRERNGTRLEMEISDSEFLLEFFGPDRRHIDVLEENLEAAGTITLEFRIMPDGAIWDLSVTADSLLEPLIPLIDSLLHGTIIDLSQPIQASIPIVVPMELKPGE